MKEFSVIIEKDDPECLSMIAEGSRISSVSRIKGHKEDTVSAWLRDAAKHAGAAGNEPFPAENTAFAIYNEAYDASSEADEIYSVTFEVYNKAYEASFTVDDAYNEVVQVCNGAL